MNGSLFWADALTVAVLRFERTGRKQVVRGRDWYGLWVYDVAATEQPEVVTGAVGA